MSDNLGIGGKKSKGVRKDRSQRIVKLQTINNVKSSIIIPNIHNFKTTQLHLDGWIKINDDLQQNELNHAINRIKRNIKHRLNNFANETKLYQEENIVIIETAEIGKTKKNYQFINLDLTLYNKVTIYDKPIVRHFMIPLLKDIIENELNNIDIFKFVGKVRGTGQYGE